MDVDEAWEAIDRGEGREERRLDCEQDRDRAVCASLPYTRIEYASH